MLKILQMLRQYDILLLILWNMQNENLTKSSVKKYFHSALCVIEITIFWTDFDEKSKFAVLFCKWKDVQIDFSSQIFSIECNFSLQN